MFQCVHTLISEQQNKFSCQNRILLSTPADLKRIVGVSIFGLHLEDPDSNNKITLNKVPFMVMIFKIL